MAPVGIRCTISRNSRAISSSKRVVSFRCESRSCAAAKNTPIAVATPEISPMIPNRPESLMPAPSVRREISSASRPASSIQEVEPPDLGLALDQPAAALAQLAVGRGLGLLEVLVHRLAGPAVGDHESLRVLQIAHQ